MKISASVDGGSRGGSRVRRPGREDPHRRQRKSAQPFMLSFLVFCLQCKTTDPPQVWIMPLLPFTNILRHLSHETCTAPKLSSEFLEDLILANWLLFWRVLEKILLAFDQICKMYFNSILHKVSDSWPNPIH